MLFWSCPVLKLSWNCGAVMLFWSCLAIFLNCFTILKLSCCFGAVVLFSNCHAILELLCNLGCHTVLKQHWWALSMLGPCVDKLVPWCYMKLHSRAWQQSVELVIPRRAMVLPSTSTLVILLWETSQSQFSFLLLSDFSCMCCSICWSLLL